MLFDSELAKRDPRIHLTKLAPLFLLGASALLFRHSASLTIAVTLGLWLLALITIALGSVTALTGRRGGPRGV
jgi:hypothetical protein